MGMGLFENVIAITLLLTYQVMHVAITLDAGIVVIVVLSEEYYHSSIAFIA